jgi:hypothetical protein
VIVETDTSMPYVFGVECGVHIDGVDWVVNGGASKLPELKNPAAGPVDRKVAELIAPEIVDGACMQIGIGAMPNAVCELLAESSVKDLGVHTEMFVDSLVTLYEAGKITGAHKAFNQYQMTYCFAAGSAQMYEFLNRNSAQDGRDLQHRADRPERTSVLRNRRHAANQWHRRPTAIHPRRVRIARGQGDSVSGFDL